MRIQDLCKGGGSRDFADIAQWSHGGGKNLGLKTGGSGGPGPQAPPPPLDPHLVRLLHLSSTRHPPPHFNATSDPHKKLQVTSCSCSRPEGVAGGGTGGGTGGGRCSSSRVALQQ